MSVEFLSLIDVLEIHRNQLALFGGLEGVRDLGLLQSAIAQPEATFDGKHLHQDLYEMAAAYAFHLTKNHPFIDGNKRTALTAALVFLELNRISIQDPSGKLLPAMLKLSSGRLTKLELAEVFRRLRKSAGKAKRLAKRR